MAYGLQSIIKGSQGKSSRHELRDKNRSKDWGGIPLTGLFSLARSAAFLTQPRTTYLGVSPPTIDRDLPHLLRNAWQTYPQANLRRVLSQVTLVCVKNEPAHQLSTHGSYHPHLSICPSSIHSPSTSCPPHYSLCFVDERTGAERVSFSHLPG